MAAALAAVLADIERIAAMPNTGAAASPLPKGDALLPLLPAGVTAAVPPLPTTAVPFGCRLLPPFAPLTSEIKIAAALLEMRSASSSAAVAVVVAPAPEVESEEPPAIVVLTGRGEKGLAPLSDDRAGVPNSGSSACVKKQEFEGTVLLLMVVSSYLTLRVQAVWQPRSSSKRVERNLAHTS